MKKGRIRSLVDEGMNGGETKIWKPACLSKWRKIYLV